jgi:hypothetical protein
MSATPRRRRPAPDLETNTAPDALRNDEPSQEVGDALTDSLAPRDHGTAEEAGDGNDQLPAPYEDQEDAPLSDYERELDRLDAATRSEH